VIETIAPDDRMFRGDRDHYFWSGESALECIREVMTAAVKDSIKRILDLPCGHGRVMRNLKAAFPEARLVACDINRSAVDFCSETFGAEPVYATEDPADLSLGEHDLVWCGSLVTHMNAERFVAFLQLFKSCLAPGGLLVFTTNGQQLCQVAHRLLPNAVATKHELDRAKDYFPFPDVTDLLGAYEATGFAYSDYPWTKDYGVSLSSQQWICDQLDRLSLRLLTFSEAGWGRTQDVVGCTRS
jgi:SAM-dependent methyltransferase